MLTKDSEEIKILREGGTILARTLKVVAKKAKPGVSAAFLNELAEKELEKAGATPSFKNYRAQPKDMPFPASLCVSVNDEVVHGIPGKNKILRDGDIVGLDLGVWYKGLCTDAAITVAVGNVSKEKKLLMTTAKQALQNGIDAVSAGKTTGDVGFAIESTTSGAGLEVVKELVGHGVGKAVHEDPEVPCFGEKGQGEKLLEGMVIAIEPMVNGGTWKVIIAKDHWTIKTYDGEPSAHFEHTVLVTATGCEILTKA